MTSLVVIGGNAAGMSCATKAKRRAPELDVTVVEAGEHISYSSCGIPHLVAGSVEEPEQLLVLSPEQAKERGVTVKTKTTAIALNAYTKEVTLQGPGGRDTVHYDKLCIATGADALNPFKGGDLKGVFSLRHMGDGLRLMEHVDSAKMKTVGIVGGGHVGLEMAEAFHKRGSQVHLFQKGPRLLPQFDADITDGLEDFLAKKGINLHMDAEVKSFGEGKRGGQVGVVHSKDAGDLNVDGVLVAVGIKPSTGFATKAGVHALSTGHILVDDTMRTNFHDMWAAGDCVAARHVVTGRPTGVPLALPSNRMGRVAGDSIAASLERIPGPTQGFSGVLGTSVMRLFGLAFAQTGLNEAQAKREGFDVVTSLIESKSKAAYMPGSRDMAVKMVADDSGKLLGVELAGPEDSALRINAAAVAIQCGLTVKRLSEVETAYAPPFSPVWDPILVAAGELAKEIRK